MKTLQKLVVALLGCASLAYSGSVRGTVRNAETLGPIPGVEVSVHAVNPDSLKIPATTDSTGWYAISDIPPNNLIYVIVAIAETYVVAFARIDDLGSMDIIYDVYLQPNPVVPPGGGGDSSKVSGSVMTRDGATPALVGISSATVVLSSGTYFQQVQTNAQGRYTTWVPEGTYSGSVTASGFRPLALTNVRIDSFGLTMDAVLQSLASDVSRASGEPECQFELGQAYPNPFNPTTTIAYSIPGSMEKGVGSTEAKLVVYDLLGCEVAVLVNERKVPGTYQVNFDGSGLATGVYIYRLSTGLFVQSRTMLLIK